jgi:hypothetical protein
MSSEKEVFHHESTQMEMEKRRSGSVSSAQRGRSFASWSRRGPFSPRQGVRGVFVLDQDAAKDVEISRNDLQ